MCAYHAFYPSVHHFLLMKRSESSSSGTVRCSSRKGFLLAVSISAIASLASSQTLSGQDVSGADPLAIPRGSLKCEVVAPGKRATKQDGSVVLRFLEGTGLVEDRVINVTYDSSGNALYLAMLAVRRDSSKVITDGFAIRFDRGEATTGYVMTSAQPVTALPGAANGQTPPPHAPPLEQLSPSKLSSAKTLAEWLWKRRCSRR